MPRLSLLLLALTGCVHAQKPVAVAEVPPAPAPQLVATPSQAPSTDPARELAQALAGATVFFEYDSDHLDTAGREVLGKVAQVLRKHPALAIRVEGHCDERGTEEYNLALGSRRADVARRFLVDLGVTEAQVETLSFGALKPAVDGSGEEAWARNRRGEVHATR